MLLLPEGFIQSLPHAPVFIAFASRGYCSVLKIEKHPTFRAQYASTKLDSCQRSWSIVETTYSLWSPVRFCLPTGVHTSRDGMTRCMPPLLDQSVLIEVPLNETSENKLSKSMQRTDQESPSYFERSSIFLCPNIIPRTHKSSLIIDNVTEDKAGGGRTRNFLQRLRTSEEPVRKICR